MNAPDAVCDFCSGRPVVAIHGTRFREKGPVHWEPNAAWTACADCHRDVRAGRRTALEIRAATRIARKHGVEPFQLRQGVHQAQQRFWRAYVGEWRRWPSE